MEDLLRSLRTKREELRGVLREDPNFQEYELVNQLLWIYESREVEPNLARASAEPEPPVRRVPPEPERSWPVQPRSRTLFVSTPTGMRAVQDAAAEYLRKKRSRADSAEIQAALVEQGILNKGVRDRQRVTSYLGRAKTTFDNIRGQGYGLKEWVVQTT